jgi:uncharacterized protein (DUF433 family)
MVTEAVHPKRPIDEIVTSNPNVLGGRIVFRGTRVPVEAVFENLADGMSLDAILQEFPTLDRNDVVALLQKVPEAIESSTAA